MGHVNRFKAMERCTPHVSTIPETEFSRAAEVRARKIERQLDRVMEEVLLGYYSSLNHDPDDWQGFSFSGAQAYNVIATTIENNMLLAFHQIGTNPSLHGTGMRQDRLGTLLQVSDGSIQYDSYQKYGRHRVYESEEGRKPKTLEVGQKLPITLPAPDEWLITSAVDRPALCTSVSTNQKMWNQDEDHSGFSILSRKKKLELLDSFNFYNSMDAF